ncbi:ATPase [Micromonospora rosaria]|uniref:ATPase n=1 Tax=Micromonospora rosaria TaxID=47874 RepID=A0A136PU03_9ACTN|nr:ATPase [Micromonospora rosaria]KXK61980.1 ATPase [Micromonospora rosaria]
MRFSVVANGYDQRQVDSCLNELGVGLARLSAWAEGAADAGREWDQVRQEAVRLRARLDRQGPAGPAPGDLDRQAADLLAQARAELDVARQEARQLRERVYAEAVQARRDFEAALQARRRRAERVDEILGGVVVEPVPADTPTAAAATGVPATRAAAPDADAATEPRADHGTRVR